MDKMYQWCIWKNVRKVLLFPKLFYPYSIVNSTPLFQNHCKQQPFLFIPTDYRSGREKILMALLLKQMRPRRLEKRDRQLLMLLWTACFLSLPEKGKVGAEKEKAREERELFYKSHLQNPGPGRRAAVVNKRAASCRRVEAQWAFAWLKRGNGSLYRPLTWEWDV